MKNGTVYAARLKKAWQKHRGGSKATEVPEKIDLLRGMARGVLGVSTSEARADKAVDKLLSAVVDWNEIRVSNAEELSRAVETLIPNSVVHCQRLIHALQDVYDRENQMALDRLTSVGRREARQFLESLAGMDEFAVASVMLWSLGGHAIPVNDALMSALGNADLVNPDASRGEVQSFLERHISAVESKDFVILMRTFKAPAASKKSTKARKAAKTTKSAKSAKTAKPKPAGKKTRKKAKR